MVCLLIGVYRAKLIRQCFTVKMIKDQKHTTKATQDFLRAKKLDIFKCF